MKKFLKKLIIFSFVSVILSSTFLLASVSAANATLGAPYGNPDEVKIPYCIDPKDPIKNSKLIQIIEEPILEPSGAKISDNPECYGDKDFFTCVCYRNTFSFQDDKKTRHISAELLSECSKSAQQLAKDSTKAEAARFDCQEVQVLFCKGGTCLITNYIGAIYRWAASIVGVIAVLVIIISAIQLSIAGGSDNAVSDAKRRIIQSIGGIAVLFLSGVILNAINPGFFTF